MPTASTIVFVGCTFFLAHYFASLFARTKIPDVRWLFTIGVYHYIDIFGGQNLAFQRLCVDIPADWSGKSKTSDYTGKTWVAGTRSAGQLIFVYFCAILNRDVRYFN